MPNSTLGSERRSTISCSGCTRPGSCSDPSALYEGQLTYRVKSEGSVIGHVHAFGCQASVIDVLDRKKGEIQLGVVKDGVWSYIGKPKEFRITVPDTSTLGTFLRSEKSAFDHFSTLR